MTTRHLRSITTREYPAQLVNAGRSRSVVGSENNIIARALSVLVGVVGRHPGNLTIDQARDVIA
jgi:hypothetical protein